MKLIKFDFEKYRKIYLIVPMIIVIAGVILSFVLVPELDISFTGGTIMKYSYTGDVNVDEINKVVESATGQKSSTKATEAVSIETGETEKQFTIEFNEKNALGENDTTKIEEELAKIYPDNAIVFLQTNSVDSTMGKTFTIKCIAAIGLAALFMILYVAFRFRKIGGWIAGVSGIVAIAFDLFVVYLAFVVFRFPLDDNFIAVILSIIGFSLNDTVVIFDRIRENRKLLGPKTSYYELATKSTNQTLGRTIYTSVCVFLAVAVVAIVALYYGLTSIVTFAIPMMFGVISGCYSSIAISVSLWVIINNKLNGQSAKTK